MAHAGRNFPRVVWGGRRWGGERGVLNELSTGINKTSAISKLSVKLLFVSPTLLAFSHIFLLEAVGRSCSNINRYQFE